MQMLLLGEHGVGRDVQHVYKNGKRNEPVFSIFSYKLLWNLKNNLFENM